MAPTLCGIIGNCWDVFVLKRQTVIPWFHLYTMCLLLSLILLVVYGLIWSFMANQMSSSILHTVFVNHGFCASLLTKSCVYIPSRAGKNCCDLRLRKFWITCTCPTYVQGLFTMTKADNLCHYHLCMYHTLNTIYCV